MRRLRVAKVARLVAVSRSLAIGLAAAFAGVLAVAACGSRSNDVGPGGECSLASDCAPGLVCVEQASNARICSDDLSRVAGRNPPEAGPAETDAATTDGEVVVDASRPDTSMPPRDSGDVPDTSAPKPDTGAPIVDASDGD